MIRNAVSHGIAAFNLKEGGVSARGSFKRVAALLGEFANGRI